VSQLSGLHRRVGLYSYHVRELLVCWLFFSPLFVLLAPVILGGVLACYAGKYATHGASTISLSRRRSRLVLPNFT